MENHSYWSVSLRLIRESYSPSLLETILSVLEENEENKWGFILDRIYPTRVQPKRVMN